jgi:hypothetical protein
MEADLEKQWFEIPRRRRNAVRREANRLISRLDGLKNAGDQLVPRPLPQKSAMINTQIVCLPKPMRRWPPCPVCRVRDKPKRSFPDQATAKWWCDIQNDPGLVVYACSAGGWHLGHLRHTMPAAFSHLPTP